RIKARCCNFDYDIEFIKEKDYNYCSIVCKECSNYQNIKYTEHCNSLNTINMKQSSLKVCSVTLEVYCKCGNVFIKDNHIPGDDILLSRKCKCERFVNLTNGSISHQLNLTNITEETKEIQ